MVTCVIISRLEADIEQLAESLDRCRKAMLLSKVAIAGGGICLLAYILGPIRFNPTNIFGRRHRSHHWRCRRVRV